MQCHNCGVQTFHHPSTGCYDACQSTDWQSTYATMDEQNVLFTSCRQACRKPIQDIKDLVSLLNFIKKYVKL